MSQPTFAEYAQRGIPLFACNHDKSPKTAHGFKDATCDQSKWLSCEHMGMPTGSIVALDVDAKNEQGLVAKFEQACKQHGFDLAQLPKQTTPNGGGAHYFFRSENEIRNEVFARNEQGKTTIETRGLGGYVCVAPSPGYTMQRGSIWDAPLIDDEALLSIARSLNRKEQPAWEPSAKKAAPWERATPSVDLTPGDAYNQRGDIFALLRAHGWHAIDKGASKWRRPGKDNGISATWDKVPGKFYVFTSSSTLEAGKAYSPFALFAYLDHAGDFAAAARALAADGYGSKTPDATPSDHGVDLSRLLEQVHSLTRKVDEAGAVVEKGDNLFTDLGPVLAGDMSPELPTIGASDDGAFLFYKGRLNELHAEPGVGKTNVLLAAIGRILNAGACVVFIDPEDNPRAICRRLIALGADVNRIAQAFKYLHDPDKDALIRARRWVEQNGAELVAIDGAAELISGTGGSERDEDDVLRFFKLYVRPFADCGSGVVITDHVAKDAESAGLWPRGSGAKMGRYDGAVYLIREETPYSPEQQGSVKLVIAKDRNGGVGAKKTNAFTVVFTPQDGRTVVEIKRANMLQNDEPDPDIEKRLLIMSALSGGAVLSAKELNSAVKGKNETVAKIRDSLAEEGYIEVREIGSQQIAIRAIRNYFPCYQRSLKSLLRAMEVAI
jgi:hypothetical protein